MSTEIERTKDITEQAVEVVEEHGSHDLLRFHRDLQLCYGFAQALVKTPFVPSQYQGNPGHAAAAIMTARGVGIMDPMTALRSLDVIQGTPAFRANMLRALAQHAGHEIWVEEANSQRVIVKGRRKGAEQVQESMWDMDRARAMGLTSKDNWKKQPQAMLTARATSELVRLIAADKLAGLYSVEELADGEQIDSADAVPVKTPAKRTMRRAAKPKPEAEPVAKTAKERVEAENALDAEAKPKKEDPIEPAEKAEPESTVEGPGSEPVADSLPENPLHPTPEEAAEWGLLPPMSNG